MTHDTCLFSLFVIRNVNVMHAKDHMCRKHMHLIFEGTLSCEARSKCIQSFDFFSFGFCRRDCNTAAHVLAQFGSKADVDCSGWVDEAPPFVSDVVASDLAVHQG